MDRTADSQSHPEPSIYDGLRIRGHGTGITGSGHPQEERCLWKKTPPETGKKPVEFGFTRGIITNGPVTNTLRPMTIVTENMTTEAVDRAIEDAREAETEIHLKDSNGKVSHNIIKSPKRREEEEQELETSELELLSNLISSTEIEQETKEHNLRRSKRLTKTNPISRLNNPVPSDYRKYRQNLNHESSPTNK